jgi:hypothetical protein
MHEFSLLIPFIISKILKKNKEAFENEKCDATDRKINLVEEKLKLELQKTNTSADKNIDKKIGEINEKILELDRKIKENTDKLNEYKKNIDEDLESIKNEDEEEVYNGFDKLNNLIKNNPVYNGLFISFLVLILTIIVYYLIQLIFFPLKKINKIDVKYDDILKTIKKNKIIKKLN